MHKGVAQIMMSKHSATVAAAAGLLLLVACGGGGGGAGPTAALPTPEPEATRPPSTASNPEYYLGTARFTTDQPDVLEQIGAHHAYARGLTGSGVRIGIEDTIIDYTQSSEFGNRVKLRDADGATLSYRHPFGDEPFSDIQSCLRIGTCTAWRGNSRGDGEALNSWVQQIVSENGWPSRDDTSFVLDEYFSENDALQRLFRWSEVPTPYGFGVHGTIVASVAAGTNVGVAPEATIIPIARNFSDDQVENAFADAALRSAITLLPSAERGQLDGLLASAYRENYAKYDIINRSYGIELFDPDVISSEIESEFRWYRQYLPKTMNALLQDGTLESQKTILVYAAGNSGQSWSGLGADLPYYVPELRGHSLAVTATNPQTGIIADYSNMCGPLPSDWNAARHGRHYCLAAPGTVRGLVPDASAPGRGDVRGGLQGTSFAAPVVSGALALLKEHFRGTRGNTEIVMRMIDTADRSGRYADLETYGAGHLDLEAALSPVGALSAGQSARALSRTTLQTPVAFGSVAQRTAKIELAAFDEQDFPFWIPLSGLISDRSAGRSPIPRFEDMEKAVTPAPGLDALNLHWTEVGGDVSAWVPRDKKWVTGFGPTSASLARQPLDDGWGYGLSFDDGGYLGSEPSGAFKTDLRSGMVWTSRGFEHEFSDGWKLNATGTLALSLAQYEKDAMFRATPSMMSAMSMRIGTRSTGVVVEQPLRAESGTGTFRLENGRIENGKRLYDEYSIPLRPDARELRMTLRHGFAALGGNFVIEAGGAVNVGHIPGEREANIGFAYRAAW